MTIVFDTLAKIGFFFVLIMGLVVVLIWMERKGAAFIQDRTGPNRYNDRHEPKRCRLHGRNAE